MVSSNVLNKNKYSHLEGKPHWRRTIAVYMALDKAPDDYSYSQLMEWVKQQTGKGCSRKLISKWKTEKSVLSEQLPVINAQKEVQELPIIVEYESLLTNESESQVTIPKWLKKVGNIIGLTATLLVANFSLTPQDSTVKLAVAEPPTTLTTPLFDYQPKPKSVEPNRIKINLTITDPSDLKVKPGDEVVKGQIISDRTTERQRLLNQRKQLELSLKKLTIPIPNIQAPSTIAKLPNLPPISYQQEQANINLKEQQLNEAVQAVSNQQQKIESLSQLSGVGHRSSINSQSLLNGERVNEANQLPLPQLNYVDANAKPINYNQKTLTIDIDSNQKIQVSNQSQNPEIVSNNQTSQSNNQPTNYNSKLKAIIEHETVILNQLKGNQAKAEQELQVAKSQLETAKEQRRYAEHQLYLENNRRALALQQQSLELERQRTIRAGQLQEQEYSKTQIEAKLIEIDNAINQLSTVKIPYNGTVKKVKWDGQTDHTLNVTVTLDVHEPSVSEESNTE
ncbi:hypothetical protein cce_5142 [Crocosphaera subtropica ATCC 51142]|uniref:Uncharacterized protein n=1 Tax=Crocosphaera subtropica (strain ATCC 51142 / BH68) TaxID=43989 RepID=B1X2X7_CROS5|nr:hypothetical protein [Crocosphaera subtropica]ACB54488.1 hypothetical protein cce_5142 [Crocosphaera subtropica ATCC 51142]